MTVKIWLHKKVTLQVLMSTNGTCFLREHWDSELYYVQEYITPHFNVL